MQIYINRFTTEERWSREAIQNMKETTWEPVLGVDGQHVPVDIDESGTTQWDGQDTKEAEIIDDEIEQGTQPKISHDKLHVSRKVIQKYGPTEGCPACDVLVRRGHSVGRIGHHHSNTCRARVVEFMEKDLEYRNLLQKHERQREVGDLEVLSVEQMEEMRGRVRNAIHCIQQKIAREQHNLSAHMDTTMLRTLIGKMELAEVYSPPRVTEMARKTGLKAGWSLDITTCDNDGEPWDFNKVEMRNRAVRKILADEPLLLIGSPMCTAFSTMNNANYFKMSAEEVKQRIVHGRKHLQFCAKFYAMQWKARRYFLHEHPAGATSWQETCIKDLLMKEGIIRVNGDQCVFGLKANDGTREGPARKTTGFLTNSVCIADQFNKRCPNRKGDMVHKHVTLESGRTRAAQVYLDDLCRAICEGLQDQIQMDEKGQFLFMNVNSAQDASSKELHVCAESFKRKYKLVEEDDMEEMEAAWDDVSGATLDPKLVRQARQEEMDYVHKMRLHDKVHTSECRRITGKPPITVRWIDINKGDKECPNYRSRIVAREINTYKRDDLFAATPPLEALKVILAMTASANKGEVIMVNDISRAFFHAKVERDVYIQLLDEDKKAGEENMCGKSRLSMYGTRDAAQNWYKEYSQQLIQMGFIQGTAFPCTFHHPARQIRT